MLDPQPARNEKRAVADIVRLAGENVYTAEVERPVERGGQKGGGCDFERWRADVAVGMETQGRKKKGLSHTVWSFPNIHSCVHPKKKIN